VRRPFTFWRHDTKKNTIFAAEKKLFVERMFLALLRKRNVAISWFGKVLISVQAKE
jgi:hypothetical protein